MLFQMFGGSLGLILGGPGEALRGSFGALGGSRWHPQFSQQFIDAFLTPHLGPRKTFNSPSPALSWRGRWPDEATRPMWKRTYTYVPVIWETKIN